MEKRLVHSEPGIVITVDEAGRYEVEWNMSRDDVLYPCAGVVTFSPTIPTEAFRAIAKDREKHRPEEPRVPRRDPDPSAPEAATTWGSGGQSCLILGPGETVDDYWMRTGAVRITRGWFGHSFLVEEERTVTYAQHADSSVKILVIKGYLGDARAVTERRWRKLRRGEPMLIQNARDSRDVS